MCANLLKSTKISITIDRTNLKTMKKFIISILAVFVFGISVNAATFSDVPETHQYYSAVESLKNLEIVNGYEDGTFKPANSVNRVEALKMILTSAKIEAPEVTEETGFPDVQQTDWFAQYVIKAKNLGIVNGNADGTFAPARNVNKAEFIKMLLESFGKDISKHENPSKNIAADVPKDAWHAPYMSYAKTLGIVSPDLNNNLSPSKFLSRGETAEIVYKLLIVELGGDTQKLLSVAESNLVSVLVALNNDDINSAIDHASEAVFYTENALSNSPEEGIVKAANKVALGFRELCYGYQAGLAGDTAKLFDHSAKAREYAGLAYNDDPSTQPLGQKIKSQADILEAQVQTQ